MPKKKKWTPPRVLKTILICCEGECELVFLSYLKDIYHSRGRGFVITSENRQGGSPDIIVKRAWQSEGYDIRCAWIDTDRTEIERARIMAKEAGILLFENDPCIEGEILRILGKTKGRLNYKRAFEKHFPGADILDRRTHMQLFPKDLLDAIREDSTLMISRIIKLLETGEM